jgi:hypothetical protein
MISPVSIKSKIVKPVIYGEEDILDELAYYKALGC